MMKLSKFDANYQLYQGEQTNRRKQLLDKCRKLFQVIMQKKNFQIGSLVRNAEFHLMGKPGLFYARLGQSRLVQVCLGQSRLVQAKLGQVRPGLIRMGQVGYGKSRVYLASGSFSLGYSCQDVLGKDRLFQIRFDKVRIGYIRLGLLLLVYVRLGQTR